MAAWIERTLFRTIELLARQGQAGLASEIKRISEIIDITEVEAFLLPQAETIIESIIESDSINTLGSHLDKICEIFQVKHCSLVVIEENSTNSYPIRVITNYPRDWIDSYIDYRFIDIDPATSRSKNSLYSFFWKPNSSISEKGKVFFERAASFGIGSTGYTSIIKTKSGDKFGFHVCTDEKYEEFISRFSSLRFDFEKVAFNLCESFCNIVMFRIEDVYLTPDQLRLLRAVSIGASNIELSDLEFSYGSLETVTKSTLQTLKSKTLTEAAVRAARSGILSSTPIDKSEVFSAYNTISYSST